MSGVKKREKWREKVPEGGGKEVAGAGAAIDDGGGAPKLGSPGSSVKEFVFGKGSGTKGVGGFVKHGSSGEKFGGNISSYRDKLLSPGATGFLVKHAEKEDIVNGWKDYFYSMNLRDAQGAQEESDEEDTQMSRRMEGKPGHLKFSADEYSTWCLPWMNSLIIKVLGASFHTYLIRDRINRMWRPKDPLKLIPLSNVYYIVSFSNKEDKEYAFQEGPWMIEDHYLIVQQWRPNFNPWKAAFSAGLPPGLGFLMYHLSFTMLSRSDG
ncbi:hypothetical protein K1719_013592 [Acacia pycnantha]|nr:hypothetical protein K1719_013592 [Acacia pycnantha]